MGLLVAQMKSILFQSLSTVILTDKYMKLIETNLDTCKTKQTQQNGHDVEIVAEKLDWTTDVSIRRPPDVILIADCIHWPEMFQPLITTLLSLTSSSPSTSTVILIAYERREFGVEASFFKMLGEHFTFTHIPETQQHPVYSSDDIYLFIARRKQSNKTKNRE